MEIFYNNNILILWLKHVIVKLAYSEFLGTPVKTSL